MKKLRKLSVLDGNPAFILFGSPLKSSHDDICRSHPQTLVRARVRFFSRSIHDSRFSSKILRKEGKEGAWTKKERRKGRWTIDPRKGQGRAWRTLYRMPSKPRRRHPRRILFACDAAAAPKFKDLRPLQKTLVYLSHHSYISDIIKEYSVLEASRLTNHHLLQLVSLYRQLINCVVSREQLRQELTRTT